MNKLSLIFLVPFLAVTTGALAQTIVETDAYRWTADSVIQGSYSAVALSPTHIESTYHATPHYYMGINPRWQLKNDISSYPSLSTPHLLHQAIYNMGLDEMVNAVEPDTTLRTGAAWGGVWTRDVSYSILLSMAYMQPEASMISLKKKVDSLGRIIQDTGSGGAWPVSTDRAIWAIAAYEIYKVTGDRDWLHYIYPVIKRSLQADSYVIMDHDTSLARGETSFIDWREQSHPRWMQTADIASTMALGTNAVHARALHVLSLIAREMGDTALANQSQAASNNIINAINRHLWLDREGYYAMYMYGRNYPLLNKRAETLGESLMILWDMAPDRIAERITESNPTTPYGTAIFYPQIADMPPYHNNALWPWVASYWALANAKTGNEAGTLEAIGSVMRPAALFCTNKENFVLDNGDIATQLNSSNMLWCLAGNIAITHKILFGLEFDTDSLLFHPFVPKALDGVRSLEGFKYRNATLDIIVSGYGDIIKSFTINGKPHEPYLKAADANGRLKVDIVMANEFRKSLTVNHQPNRKAPLTPIARFDNGRLAWDPIEYSSHYIVVCNGQPVSTTRSTTFDITRSGEYQVIAVDADSIESFASQPVSCEPTLWFEMSDETTTMTSTEVLFDATTPITGYQGAGFVETDHSNSTISLPVTIPQDAEGTYFIKVRYANGNGMVCTGNSAAVRTVMVDNLHAGSIIMPHRGDGNWCDWGMSTAVKAHFTPGQHTITLQLTPLDENMNLHTNHCLIDAVQLTKSTLHDN